MMRNLKYLSTLALALSCQLLSAQETRLSGIIQDSQNGKSLSGVTVRVLGGKQETTTDNKGKFSLVVNAGDVLVFHSVGYRNDEVKVEKAGHLHISLVPDNKMIDEVLVTGAFGIKRDARQLGVSTAVVDSKTLNQAAVVNPLEDE